MTVSVDHLLRHASAARSDESGIWNVFVQLLLPLVIILSFAAVLEIDRYQKIIDQTQRQNDDLRLEMKSIDSTDPQRLAENLARTVFLSQRRKLQIALELAVQDDRKEWLFTELNADGVKLLGARIDDRRFAEFSQLVWSHLGPAATRTRFDYVNDLYKDVLALADIRDTAPEAEQRVRLWPEGIAGTDPEFARFDAYEPLGDRVEADRAELANIRDNIIHPANRAFLHNQINGEAWRSETQAVALQTAVIDRIYQSLIANPEQLDEASRERVREMVNPDTPAERREILAELVHDRTISALRERLEGDGYTFLTQTWTDLGLRP